jgi:branched-chain amino acid transport system substrate-binding protein
LYYKAFFTDGIAGFQARIDRQNAAGGVYGRKIVIDKAIDDGADVNADAAGAKTLVADGVFAVAPVLTPAFNGLDYLEAQKVPYVGWAIEPNWCGMKYGVPFSGTDCSPLPRPANYVPFYEKIFGGSLTGRTIAFATEDSQSATQSVAPFQTNLVAAGMRVTTVDKSLPAPPATVGDFTPYASRLMTSAGGKAPDMIQINASPSNVLPMITKLKQLGYRGKIVNFVAYDPRLASATTGVYTAVQLPPYEQPGAGTTRMVADLTKQSTSIVLGQSAEAGYYAADLFIQVLQRAGKNLSRESFMKAATDGKPYTVNDSPLTVKFPENQNLPKNCFGVVQAAATTFKVTAPFTCLDNG